MKILLGHASICILFLSFLSMASATPLRSGEPLVIGWWNMENMFDTVNDADRLPQFGTDDEFTPGSEKHWNSERYQRKLKNMAKAITSMNDGKGPDILGVCEVEHEHILHEMIDAFMPEKKYGVVYHESPDARGIDVGIIFDAGKVKLEASGYRTVPLAPDEPPTRDIVFAEFASGSAKLVCIFNHWPSRRGGTTGSEHKRVVAAKACRALVDSILSLDPSTDVVVMGDFNDGPSDVSITQYLKATSDQTTVGKRGSTQLYNCMTRWSSDTSKGTFLYRGSWDMFDQVIISSGLFDRNGFTFDDVEIFSSAFLKEKSGKYAGAPYPTYAGNKYLGGYSDHLPVLLHLTAWNDDELIMH